MATDRFQRRQRLRQATETAHARLDAFVDAAGLLRSAEAYERYLQATWSARRPSETALDASELGALYPDWPRRRLGEALRQDLQDVSGQPAPDADADEPAPPLSVGQALGVLYVLEGSALGARLLERRAAAIGMTSTFGARHMARQTGEPKAWPSFLDLLERTAMDDAEEQACLAAALRTFEDFETAFRAAAAP